MTASESSSQLTERLLSVVRQQRHLATRVIIATQEPTISPALLELSSMTIVHRFQSPNWLKTLKSHLVGLANEGETPQLDMDKILKRIALLPSGQALVFSPSAMLGVADADDNGTPGLRMNKLGTGYLQVQIRLRLSKDGGGSILAA